MRESMGGAWLTGLVITFMLIFVAYLTVMINYSTVFKTKNEVVHIIEKYEGLSEKTDGSVQIINQYLANSGYNAKGKCECKGDPNSCYGAEDLSSHNLTKNPTNGQYYYCVQYTNSAEKTGYYDVQLFLKFDLPVLGQIGQFKIKGQTIKIKYPTGYDSLTRQGVN